MACWSVIKTQRFRFFHSTLPTSSSSFPDSATPLHFSFLYLARAHKLLEYVQNPEMPTCPSETIQNRAQPCLTQLLHLTLAVHASIELTARCTAVNTQKFRLFHSTSSTIELTKAGLTQLLHFTRPLSTSIELTSCWMRSKPKNPIRHHQIELKLAWLQLLHFTPPLSTSLELVTCLNTFKTQENRLFHSNTIQSRAHLALLLPDTW